MAHRGREQGEDAPPGADKRGPKSAEAGTAKLRVLVSCSRDDLDFADQLVAGLAACGFEPILDRQGIASREDGPRRSAALTGALIADADTAVFVLSPGLAADVVVFDPERIADGATFGEPDRPSTGVKAVLVNGAPVLLDGKYTGAAPGKVLRGPGARR